MPKPDKPMSSNGIYMPSNWSWTRHDVLAVDDDQKAEPPLDKLKERTLQGVADHEYLGAVYRYCARKKGKGPGPDGLSWNDLSPSEFMKVLRAIEASILAGTYRPHPPLEVSKGKPGGGTRTLKIHGIFDRTVAKAVQLAIDPVLDPQFLDLSWGFRPRRDVKGLLGRVRQKVDDEEWTVIGQDDIRDAFGCVNVDEVCRLLTAQQFEPGLVQLAGHVLRQEITLGTPQGCSLSPLALNLGLHHRYDVHCVDIDNQYETQTLRYADNLIVLGKSETSAAQTLQRAGAILATGGFHLKGLQVVDLRQQTVADCLGRSLSLHGGRLRMGIAERNLKDLESDRCEAHESDNPPQTALLCLMGWIDSFAPVTESPGTYASRLLGILVRSGFQRLLGVEEILDRLTRPPAPAH